MLAKTAEITTSFDLRRSLRRPAPVALDVVRGGRHHLGRRPHQRLGRRGSSTRRRPAPARHAPLRRPSSAPRWRATHGRPPAAGPGGPAGGFDLALGLHDEAEAGRSPNRPATRPRAKAPAYQSGLSSDGRRAQFVQALPGPGQVVRLFARGLLEVRAQGRIARGERLRRVERLGADLADVVHAHQRGRVPALVRRQVRGVGGTTGQWRVARGVAKRVRSAASAAPSSGPWISLGRPHARTGCASRFSLWKKRPFRDAKRHYVARVPLSRWGMLSSVQRNGPCGAKSFALSGKPLWCNSANLPKGGWPGDPVGARECLHS
jgi:hypothetical protein